MKRLIDIENGHIHLPCYPRCDRWLTAHEFWIVALAGFFGGVGLGCYLWALSL